MQTHNTSSPEASLEPLLFRMSIISLMMFIVALFSGCALDTSPGSYDFHTSALCEEEFQDVDAQHSRLYSRGNDDQAENRLRGYSCETALISAHVQVSGRCTLRTCEAFESASENQSTATFPSLEAASSAEATPHLTARRGRTGVGPLPVPDAPAQDTPAPDTEITSSCSGDLTATLRYEAISQTSDPQFDRYGQNYGLFDPQTYVFEPLNLDAPGHLTATATILLQCGQSTEGTLVVTTNDLSMANAQQIITWSYTDNACGVEPVFSFDIVSAPRRFVDSSGRTTIVNSPLRDFTDTSTNRYRPCI